MTVCSEVKLMTTWLEVQAMITCLVDTAMTKSMVVLETTSLKVADSLIQLMELMSSEEAQATT